MDFIPDFIPPVVVKAWAALPFLFAFGATLRQFGGAGWEADDDNAAQTLARPDRQLHARICGTATAPSCDIKTSPAHTGMNNPSPK